METVSGATLENLPVRRRRRQIETGSSCHARWSDAGRSPCASLVVTPEQYHRRPEPVARGRLELRQSARPACSGSGSGVRKR
jgi:hypothetical protein